MRNIQHVLHHPAGLIGLTIGLIIGLVAALMGEASKALFFAGFCKLLASRMTGAPTRETYEASMEQ